METTDSCVPPGFRFHPTDEELVGYYLTKKVASRKIDLDVIKDIDLYKIEPWDLQEKCSIGQEEQTELYFFSHKDKKYPTGTRTNRATMAGFWKATGRDKAIYNKQRLIGMRKTLVFYKGRAPNGQKTDWIMHEYRLETDETVLPQEEGWVVCRAFKKRPTCQTRNSNESLDPNYYFYDHGSNSILDSLDFISGQRTTAPCKQEIIDAQKINYKISLAAESAFLQLPQLESPKVEFHRTPISLFSREDERDCRVSARLVDCESKSKASGKIGREGITDWRALDRFVASQLSQEETNDNILEEDLGDQQGGELGSCGFVREEQRDNKDLIFFPFEGLGVKRNARDPC